MTARANLDALLKEQVGEPPPKKWGIMSRSQRLDHIATRILAQSRTTTSFTEISDEGILSVSQYGRRRNREVFSKYGSLEDLPPTRGVFGRTHVKR